MAASEFRAAEQRLWDSLDVEAPIEHRLALPTVGATVRVQEVGHGPAAVFLHGASVAGSTWATLAARLPDVRCLLVDRPGCGGSDPVPGMHDLDRMVEVAEVLVADVLDALDLESAHVVGTSRGGFDAIRGAAAHPDRVDRLLLFGWCMGAPGSQAPLWLRMGALPGAGRLMAAMPASRRSVRAMLGQFGLSRAIEEGRFSDEMLDWLVALFRHTDTLDHEVVQAPAVLAVRHGWDQRLVHDDRVLAAVTAPACLVWGEEDPFGDPDVARRLAAGLSDARLHLLPRTGHAPWLDDLDVCATIARDVLVAPAA